VTGPAELVVTGALVWTGPGATAEAFAVSDGVFVYVGDTAGAAAFVGPDTQQVSLSGGVVVPGFVDAHVHPLEGGVELAECTLSDAETAEDALAAVARCAADGDGWLLGNGWELTLFPGGAPTASALDAVTEGRPTFLLAADGHSAWLDHEGLARAGIKASTPDPVGGRIERDADGAPTGTLREAAVDLAYEVLPSPSAQARAEGLLAAQSLLHAAGVTSVLEANAAVPALRTYRRLQRRGELTLRVSVALETDAAEGPAQVRRLVRWRRRFDGDGLRVTTAKLFVDGVLESRTAAMLTPYVDTGTTVPPDWTPAALTQTVSALLRAGFEVHAHTIGDRAVREVLDAVAAARAEGSTGRVALAHLEVVDPADVPRFAALDVDAVFQPLWAWPDEYVRDLTWPGLAPEVGARLYPIGDLARAGAPLAFGSDWSVSSLVPLEGVEVAVRRSDPDDGSPDVLGVDQALSVEEALAAYTAGAGRVVGLGTGRIAVGAPADWVVLSADPRVGDPSAAQVVETRVAGQRVFP
jgi:predicted amidohydrolase YtcJ